MKFSGNAHNDKRNKWLNFAGDPEFPNGFFVIAHVRERCPYPTAQGNSREHHEIWRKRTSTEIRRRQLCKGQNNV